MRARLAVGRRSPGEAVGGEPARGRQEVERSLDRAGAAAVGDVRLHAAARLADVDPPVPGGEGRGTPLESTLPVNMELDSKKVLPSGALALVMHGMEFMNGNQIARDCALGVLEALGPQDEMGVVLWDGTDHWLFPMTKVADKAPLGRRAFPTWSSR